MELLPVDYDAGGGGDLPSAHRISRERLSDQRFSAFRHQLRRPAVLDLHQHLRQRCAVQPHFIDRGDTELGHARRLHCFTAYFTPYGPI